MDFNNNKELKEAIEKQFAEALNKPVVNKLKEIEKEVIDDKVLGVYDPLDYTRRAVGGIDDVRNMKHTVNKQGDKIVLSVENETDTFNDRDYDLITAIVQGGDFFEYPYKNRDSNTYTYLKERDFISEIRERIKKGEIAEELKKELIKKGFKID